MPDIPEGARVPDDHKIAQSELIKPEEHPAGWELLRDPSDIEYWEYTTLVALVAEIKTRGDRIEMTASLLKKVGLVVKELQTVFARNSAEFREWIRSFGGFDTATVELLPLIFAYVNALGEADSSAS
ncbi:hypothetical protein LLS1_18480 [Leifsonia sp. LS1]|uniref:hypothetical protein n=1 Tax=Leifsonia sp. LS1 TaxID=2828483 RepID=UPI001CFF29AE|nr:hypothetical protein [Leifsonia sp. LS1]GIT80179.1 hypothetical protein LLS1_18480 [Leifsonia sp. LS1]